MQISYTEILRNAFRCSDSQTYEIETHKFNFHRETVELSLRHETTTGK